MINDYAILSSIQKESPSTQYPRALTATHNERLEAIIDAEFDGAVGGLTKHGGFDAEVKSAHALVTRDAGDGVEHTSIMHALTQRRTSTLRRLTLDLWIYGWKQNLSRVVDNHLC